MPALIDALDRQRKADTTRRRVVVILAGVSLVVLLIAALVGYPSWQKARRVRQVQATALDKAPALQPLIERFGMQFVEVPAGEFSMGSPQAMGGNDEHPQHSVALDGYWIGLTEVTNAQYQPFITAGGYDQRELWTTNGWAWRQSKNVIEPEYWGNAQWNAPDQPVVGVSWYEAIAYTRWLARETGLDVRLPSEAEWEKAARGTDGRIYPWGDQEPTADLINFNSQVKRTTVAGSYPPGASPYGALDMAGNAGEWTSSLRMDYPYQRGDGRENLDAEGVRVMRGGSWYSEVNSVRVSVRLGLVPQNRRVIVGFRIVWSPGF